MQSKAISDKARTIVATVLLNSEVSAMLRRIKNKSIITYEHCLNVAFIVAQILISKDLSEEEVVHITEGALLHDIGKLYINESILEKRAALSPDERKEMQKHPELGLKLLVSGFTDKRNDVVKNIVVMHHERNDGSGYPKGLKEKDIPWYVQIVSASDMFDALTAERPYGEVYSYDAAICLLYSAKYSADIIQDIENIDIK